MQRVSVYIEKNIVQSDATENFIDLNLLQKKMKSIRFYGETRILWQDGEIAVIREERTIKPREFNRFVESSF